MTQHPINNAIVAGTTSGTLLTLMVNVTCNDLVRTVILGVVGAVVSFLASLILKFSLRKLQKAKK